MPIKPISPRPGKSPYWYGRGTHLGISLFRSTQATKKAHAKKIIRNWEREIERGRFAEPGEPTFASCLLKYINAGGEDRYLNPLLEHFKETPIKNIGQDEIDDAAVKLYPNASNATRNRYVYTPCSAVLRAGGRDIRLRRPKGANGRELTGWLYPEQAWPLISECSKLDREFGLYCLMLLLTGERMSEPLQLRCIDIRLAEKFAYLPTSKNGDPRPIYLPKHLVKELKKHPRGLDRGEQRLFKFHRSGHLYALLKAAAAKAEVTLPPRQAFHIFCHTYATWMRRFGGIDTRGLVGTGRWRDRKSVHRYEHVVTSEEAQRAELLPVPKRA